MKNFFNKLMYGKSNRADYTKEDIQSESKTKLFVDILGVKYGQLIKLNLILILCLIPTIFWTWWTFSAASGVETIQERAFYNVIYTAGLIPCLLILAAPLAGITYIIRNFTQDKHVWLWKDLMQHTKSNAKQAVLYMLIYSVAIFIGQIVLYTYTTIMQVSPGTTILRGIYLVIYILVIISAMYAFPMMVTYELKLKDIIRNSLLLTVGSLNTTFLGPVLALLPFALLFLLWYAWTGGLVVLVLYFLIFGLAFGIYVLVSFTTSVFEKHMNASSDEESDDETGDLEE